jgi:hypothetical protein
MFSELERPASEALTRVVEAASIGRDLLGEPT